MSKLSGGQLDGLAAQVRLCVFDVDGVLTDGKIILGPNNTEFKAFDVKDGQGLVMLGEVVEVGIITGRQSQIVALGLGDFVGDPFEAVALVGGQCIFDDQVAIGAKSLVFLGGQQVLETL